MRKRDEMSSKRKHKNHDTFCGFVDSLERLSVIYSGGEFRTHIPRRGITVLRQYPGIAKVVAKGMFYTVDALMTGDGNE